MARLLPPLGIWFLVCASPMKSTLGTVELIYAFLCAGRDYIVSGLPTLNQYSIGIEATGLKPVNSAGRNRFCLNTSELPTAGKKG